MKEKLKCGLRKLDGFDGYCLFRDDEFVNLSCALSVDKSSLSLKDYGSIEQIMRKILSEALALYFGPCSVDKDAVWFDSKFHDFVLKNFDLEEFCGEYVPYLELRNEFCSRFKF